MSHALTDFQSESEDTHGGRAMKRNNDTIRQRQWDNAQRLMTIGLAKMDLETRMKKSQVSERQRLKSLKENGETYSLGDVAVDHLKDIGKEVNFSGWILMKLMHQVSPRAIRSPMFYLSANR